MAILLSLKSDLILLLNNVMIFPMAWLLCCNSSFRIFPTMSECTPSVTTRSHLLDLQISVQQIIQYLTGPRSLIVKVNQSLVIDS